MDLKTKLENLSQKNKEIFERIFEFREIELNLNFDEKFQEFKKQKIIFIKDKILEKEVIFNLTRRKRKQPEKQKNIENDIYPCPFCNYQKETPIDELGRLENESAVTSANLAKMADYHSLIIFKKHNFQELNSRDFILALNLAKEWFEKIKKFDSEVRNQILIFNYNYRAGASILHTHFQILSYKEIILPVENLIKKIQNYKENFNSDYFQDYFNLAEELGIGKNFDNCKVWFSLTPYKEKGMNIFGEINEKVFNLIKKLESQSFNLCYVYDLKFGFFVDRGEENKINSDFGTLEILGIPVISFDPFELSEKIFN